jgi:hypothetical protein
VEAFFVGHECLHSWTSRADHAANKRGAARHAGSAWFDAQVGVYLVYAAAAGHGVIDRELLSRWRVGCGSA